MSTSPFHDLTQVLSGLSAAPATAQQRLDEQWEHDSTQWAMLVESLRQQAPGALKGEIAGILAPTSPVRQVIQRYEIDCRIRVQTEHQYGFSIRAHPLDLGWEKVFGSLEDRSCRVRVTVDAVPLPAMPSVMAGLPIATDYDSQPSKQEKK